MMKRGLTLLIAICLILSACTKTATPVPTAEKASGGIATPETKPEEVKATQVAAATPSGAPIEHLKSGDFVYISRIQMFDPTRGWGAGHSGSGDDRLLATLDAGQTWADFTPPEPASTGETTKRAAFFFTSFEKGWVVYHSEDLDPQLPFIWYTTNSGNTWTVSEALDAKGMEGGAFKFQDLAFINDQTGWLVLTGDPGAGQAPAIIFRTTNGGQKWDRIVDPQSDKSGSIGECCQTGMAFLDDKVGIITSLVPPSPQPHVNWTKDGGKTWTEQMIPVADETVFTISLCGTESPVVVGATLILVVDCTEYTGMIEKHTPYLYFTTNQGQSWQFRELPITPYAEGKWSSLTRTNEIVFVDAQTGWYFTEDFYAGTQEGVFETKNQIFQTTDGGQTWTKINRAVWIGQYSFVNPQVGFAAALFNTAYTLVKTTDGGNNWAKLSPTVK
jgi:photosystem II stability/assembly factor-like uncharacterized protein